MIQSAPYDVVYNSLHQDHSRRVSVVTPAFNPGDNINWAVASLNGQSSQNFEWVIVDDCSREPASIIEAARRSEAPVIVLRHRENTRQGQARNTGLAFSRSPFVKFLDADDALDPHHIEKLLDVADGYREKRQIAFAPTRHVFLNRGKTQDNLSYQSVSASRNSQLSRMLIAPFLHHCGALFPIELLEHLGGYETSLATDEDGDLILRAILAGWLFEPVPEVSYLYQHHSKGERVSIDDSREKILSRKRVCERMIGAFESTGEALPRSVRNALCYRLDALAVRSWTNQPNEAHEMLTLASKLDANYAWSGSAIEKSIRKLAGIGSARRIISFLRAARGGL